MTTSVALAVLDFSGTLSPGAAGFAADDRIAAELRRSGLAALGFADPADFWHVLVNPTWERGSTSRIGYVPVLTDAAAAHVGRRGDGVDRVAIARAVRRFADRYLTASAIAHPWHRWLRQLDALTDVRVVVATDHYAEATDRIVEIGEHVKDDFKVSVDVRQDPFLDERLRVANLPEEPQTVSVTNPVSGATKDVQVTLFRRAGEIGQRLPRSSHETVRERHGDLPRGDAQLVGPRRQRVW